MKLFRFTAPVTLGVLGFLLGLTLTLLLTWQVVRLNQSSLVETLEQQAEDLSRDITQRLRFYSYGLRGARGYLITAGEDGISRSGFLRYSQSRDIESEFPGARGFGFIRRLAPDQVPDFVSRARQEGFADMEVRQFAPHTGDLYVIQYTEPLDRNYQGIGLDVASEENRRAAAVAAMRSGAPQMTGPITLLQASGYHHQSFLILLPVYKAGASPVTVTEREQATFGWSYVALLMQEVLKGLPLDPRFFSVALFDVTTGDAVRFYASEDSAQTSPKKSVADYLRHSQQIDIYGRQWLMELNATPAFAKRVARFDPLQIFALGCLLSFLSASLASLLAMARRRKRQVHLAQVKLAALVESSTDGIIGKTLQGVVTSWNRGAENLFGIPARQALGRQITDLIVPESLVDEEAMLTARVSRGEAVSSFETRRRRSDGTELQVSLALAPLCDERGEPESISTTVRDISAQKAAEAEVRKLLEAQVAERTSELDEVHHSLQSILDGLPLLVGYWDRNLVNQLANHCYEEWLGIAAVTIPGMHMSELVGPELLAEIRPAIDEVLAGGRPHFETTLAARDGFPERHIVIHYIPDVAEGVVQGFYVIAHDITDYRVMQNRHDQLRQLLEAVLSSASEVAIIAADLEGRVTLFNTGAERMLGYSNHEAVGKASLLDFHRSDEIAARAAELRGEFGRVDEFRTLSLLPERRGSEIRHWTYVRRDGSELRVSLAVTPIRDVMGEIEGYLGVALDVTAEQRSRQHLLALSQQLQIAADVAELGIWRWELNSDRLDWNERMFALYEQPVDLRDQGVSLQHWFERLHPQERDQVIQRLNLALAAGDRFEMAFRLLLPSGAVRHIQCVAQVARRADGAAAQVTGINRDITRQQEHEALIQREKDVANAANQAKSAFLANMSHEIRTPLNAVLGMLQLAGRTPLDVRQRDYIDKAHSAAKSLLSLLNDILDFSKIDSGKLELDLHPFEPETLLRELAVVLSGNQQDKDIEILFDVDPSIPRTLIGDSLRLRQILINLAGNALKFTARGHVTVAFHLVRREAQEVVLRISVIDTGIGIAPEQLARIFDGFVQGETSTSRRFGGTGLGLAISKRLVNLMGGELEVESEAGVGSCFKFELAFTAASEMPLLPPSPVELHLKVLVVDDNPLSAEILSRLIQNLGWRVETASSGAAAIDKALAAQAASQPFQLILMDWRMPGLDGLETSVRMREVLASDTPMVVMVTAFGREALSGKAQQGAPFRDLLTKPVTPQQLVDSVARVFDLAPATVEAAPVADAAALPLAGLHILVVEDNAVNRQVAEELLVSAGATVALAEGGMEALAALNEQRFDLVIMDMQMPGLDGLETTRLIRARQGFANLPILAMTANASSADREACIAAGMNDHVSKPIDMSQVIPAVLNLVSRTGMSTTAPAQRPDVEPVIEDEMRILQRFGGNRKLLARLVDRFAPEADRHLAELRGQLASADLPGLVAVLHSFKGVAANMGASALAKMLGGLESSFKDSPSVIPAQILNSATLEALGALTRQSTDLLRGLTDTTPATAPAPDADPAAPPLLGQLRQLHALLSAGDLRAVQTVETLAASRPGDQSLQSLAAQVQSLDFASAISVLNELIQSPEQGGYSSGRVDQSCG